MLPQCANASSMDIINETQNPPNFYLTLNLTMCFTFVVATLLFISVR